MARKHGFDQIQLNTTGITIGQDPALAVKLRHAGVSTLYMSFDGVTGGANPKNHWEAPSTLDACRKAGMSVVLVPTVIRTINEHELGAMINFGLNNIDVVRAVNFQPVSLVGRMPTRLREKQRITIPGAIKLIEAQTNGAIRKDDWASVPYIGGDKQVHRGTVRLIQVRPVDTLCLRSWNIPVLGQGQQSNHR